MAFSQYTNKEVTAVLNLLQASEQGLSHEEAAVRLKRYGLNELKEKRVRALEIFLRQFKSPFFYLLFVAAFIALLLGEIVDGVMIFVFVLINLTLGFLQEFRSERAIALLKKYTSQNVRVLRERREKVIDKKLLVPGDVVLLESGNIVPVDLRALKVKGLLVDESVLTGESVPVAKQSEPLIEEAKEVFAAKNILFGGTAIVSGEAEGIVIEAGRETVVGEIARLVAGLSRESLYAKDLLYLSKLILRIVVGAIAVIFIAKLIIHRTTDPVDFLIFCIVLIVSILPEALPVVVTFALSQGALKLAKEKVVIRRLSAIEDLGNIEVLCTDKTGTLTQNKLLLENVFSPNKEKCLLYSLLVSHYVKEEIDSSANPFDIALFEKSSGHIREKIRKFKAIAETPFDPFRMRASALLEDDNGERMLIVKGAPETILKLSSAVEGGGEKEEILAEIGQQGLLGKRTLAVAFKKFDKLDFNEEDEKNLNFLGYLTFIDPLKETAKEAVKLAEKLGVEIKIVTGDSAEVAGFIAKEVGLVKNITAVLQGQQLETLSEEEFDEACQEFSVFARVSPEIKYKIIQSLEKKYEVGFLGEGINDAPALKIAHVAISVPAAADVSREVSDIVLTQRDLRVIVDGIQRGRTIFSNVNKYIKCALASNFGNFYSIAVISLFISYLPMLPVQILLGNLLSDFPLITIATDYVDPEELERPKLYQLHKIVPLIIVLALVSTLFDFIFFAIFHNVQAGVMQTLWFIESILTEISLIFIIRTAHFFLKAKKPSLTLVSFVVLDAVVIISLPFLAFGQTTFHFVAPPLNSLFLVFFLVASYFALSEIVKLAYYHYWQSQNKAV